VVESGNAPAQDAEPKLLAEDEEQVTVMAEAGMPGQLVRYAEGAWTVRVQFADH
jgi:hypothetical protein